MKMVRLSSTVSDVVVQDLQGFVRSFPVHHGVGVVVSRFFLLLCVGFWTLWSGDVRRPLKLMSCLVNGVVSGVVNGSSSFCPFLLSGFFSFLQNGLFSSLLKQSCMRSSSSRL